MRFATVLGFLIPLYSLSTVILVEWSVYKLAPILILIWVIVRHGRLAKANSGAHTVAWLLLVYMMTITAVVYGIHLTQGNFLRASLIGGDYVRVFGHMPIQFVTMSIVILFLPIIKSVRQSNVSFCRFVNGFLYGVMFSSVFAFAMFFLANVGIGVSENFFIGYYETKYERLAGLSGEPRHFGALLVLAIMLILVDDRHWLNKKKWHNALYLLIFGLALVGTKSTSAWMGFAVSITVWFFLQNKNSLQMPKVSLSLNKILAVFSIGLFVLVIGLNNYTLIDERLLSRISTIDAAFYFVPKDALAFDYLASNPVYLLFGAGAGGLDYLIMDPNFVDSIMSSVAVTTQVLSLKGDLSFTSALTPSSFLMRWVSYFGLVGLGILIILFRQMIKGTNGLPGGEGVRKLILVMLPASAFLSTLSVVITLYIVFWAYVAAKQYPRVRFAKAGL